MPFLKDVLEVQNEYPRAGEFRVHGILEARLDGEVPSERTVGRAMAINREAHAAPGPWQSDKKEVEADTTPKYLPYRPQHRHPAWYVDIRYLVKLDDHWIYSNGFVSIQRFYLYAERGLARKRVFIWIYEGKLQIKYQQTMLAKYACEYD